MTKVKHAASSRRRRKRVLKAVEGQYGGRSRLHRIAKVAIRRGGVFNYIDRKKKKRNFRSLWISRIAAACKLEGITYSKFIFGLVKAGVKLNRKILAHLAVNETKAFKTLVKKAKA